MILRADILLIFGITSFLSVQCSPSGDAHLPDAFIDDFINLTETEPESASGLADSLAVHMNIPYISGKRVLFLYESDARAVDWRGDFNQWGGAGKTLRGVRIVNTDWWFTTTTFPEDARLDYKIVVNDTLWITDPANPEQQLGGAGYNSVIKMPAWTERSVEAPSNNRVNTGEQKLFNSRILSANLAYRIHYSSGFDRNSPYGILVVTDGHEYDHPEMGNLTSQADYLSSETETLPLAIILLDPRDPRTGQNNRADYFVRDPGYLEFVGTELPQKYAGLFQHSEKTAILGTSFGGYFATQLARLHPGVYQHAIIQSPAYWPKRDIIDAWKETPSHSERRFVITYGTFFDGAELTAGFADILEEKFPYTLRVVVNEGHSWGAWRHQLPQALQFVFTN